MAKCKHFAATLGLLVFPVHLFSIRHGGAEVFAVHLGDVIHGDTLRAGGLAFVKVRAVAEAFLVHLSDHGKHTLLRLDPMTTVRAKRIKKIKLTLTLANTTRQYESLLAHSLRQEAEVRNLGRYKTAGSDDAVESGTVDGAVTDNRECGGAPRFHLFFVHDVEHLEERHVRRNVVDLDSFELSPGLGILLAPNLQSQIQSAAANAAFSFGRSPLRGSGYILWVARFTPFPSNLIKRSLAP